MFIFFFMVLYLTTVLTLLAIQGYITRIWRSLERASHSPGKLTLIRPAPLRPAPSRSRQFPAIGLLNMLLPHRTWPWAPRRAISFDV